MVADRRTFSFKKLKLGSLWRANRHY